VHQARQPVIWVRRLNVGELGLKRGSDRATLGR